MATFKELVTERYRRGRPQEYAHSAFNSWKGIGSRYEHYKKYDQAA